MDAQATLNKQRHKVFSSKNMVMMAMFGAVAMVLMLVDFSVPFAPSFLKLDFADLPVILGTFMMGPVEGLIICIIKLVLKLLVKGTATAFVGEVANFVACAAYILPAALVYHYKKGKGGAALSLFVGTITVSIACIFTNMFIMFPAYSALYGMPMEAIIGMGTAITERITDLFSLMLYGVLPFNLLKYSLVSIMTFLVYKRLKKALFKTNQ